MKNKNWKSILACLMVCTAIFFLAACGDTGKLNEKSPIPDNQQTPSDDDNKVEYNTNARDYIAGVTIIFRPDSGSYEDSFLDGVTGIRMHFDRLLDRQMTMLSQDILHRLVAIYGAGYTTDEVDDGILFIDKDSNQIGNYSQGLYPAGYDVKNAIANYNEEESGYVYSSGEFQGQKVEDNKIDLTKAESWADAVLQNNEDNIGTVAYLDTNLNPIINNFGFLNTIKGYNTNSDRKSAASDYLYDFAKSSNETYRIKWNWTAGEDRIANENNLFLELYENNFKYALSSLLLTGEYDAGSEYRFDQTAALDMLKSNCDLENFTGIEPDISTLSSMTDEEIAELDLMHTYKAYDLIINAILDQVASNTFKSINETLIVKPIYPQMPRLTTTFLSWVDIEDKIDATNDIFQTDKSLKINSIIIHPEKTMRLSSIGCSFESLVGNDYFTKINVTFVAQGEKYYSSQSISGTNNSFQINAEIFPEFNTGKSKPDVSLSENNTIGAIYEFPVWYANDYKPLDAIGTFSNPFTISQTNSTDVAVLYDGGTNYIEFSFRFFQDEKLKTPLESIPEYSFGIIGYNFEYENLD